MTFPLLLAPLLLAATGWCQAPAADPAPPFAEFAAAFRKAHAIEGADPTDFDAQAFLEKEWIFEKLGCFDFLYPRAGLESKARQEELRTLAKCILEIEAQWLEWFGQGAPSDAARADLALLQRWLASARPQSAKQAEEKLTLFTFLGAGEKERAAAARLVAAFEDGLALGTKPRGEKRPQILFAPTRKEFLDVVAFFGWADPERQSAFWNDGATRWSECYWNETQVLSLEDPPSRVDPANPWAGTTMNLKAPTGAVEHVATRASHSLCTGFYGFALDPAFQSGLCQNVAIAIYGRNNSRGGGSGRGNSVDGWSMFVPGGMSQGGVLPPNSADNVWRSTAGADWFVKPLRDSQRVASKDATMGKEKTSTFEITANDKVKRHFVRAPFLGAAAATKELPPQEFLPDYLEFFRAYKSCYVHWMLEEGAGKSGKTSHAKLAELLRDVAAAPDGTRFDDLVAQRYGVPWSAQDPKPESLEWSFLAWLSRQK